MGGWGLDLCYTVSTALQLRYIMYTLEHSCPLSSFHGTSYVYNHKYTLFTLNIKLTKRWSCFYTRVYIIIKIKRTALNALLSLSLSGHFSTVNAGPFLSIGKGSCRVRYCLTQTDTGAQRARELLPSAAFFVVVFLYCVHFVVPMGIFPMGNLDRFPQGKASCNSRATQP